VIIFGTFDAKSGQFGIEAADALENRDFAGLAESFADHFRLHERSLP
jgi:hypothetical protein